jgi:outer membrane usher protein
VAHAGGITFGQPTSDTIAIVYAPGAAGAKLESAIGVHLNSAGYAVVPYLMPYNLDSIQIDPKGLPLDVQFDNTSVQVAPYAGAVLMVTFKTENGRPLIARARLPDGQPIPFGAEVFNAKGVSHSCSFGYRVPQKTKGKQDKSYQVIDATCVPADAQAMVDRSGT